MNAQAIAESLDAGGAAFAAAGSLAEEALALHREALALLDQGWRSQSSSAVTDLLAHQCGEAAELVAALQDAAGEFRALRDAAQCRADPAADLTYSRLGDRPAARFDAPEFYGGAPAPAPQQFPPQIPQPASVGTPPVFPAPALSPLPDLGGALVGLVASIADAVSADTDAVSADTDAVSADSGAVSADTAGPERAGDGAEPQAEASSGSPTPTAEPQQPVQPAAPIGQPVSPAVPSAGPQPVAPPPEPLLAAERPPDPAADALPEPPLQPEPGFSATFPAPPSAQEDLDTPCEIAADELPQVGG